MNGIIVVNKQKDWTSFDVVAKLRGILREKRIGHGGTLDPMAEGVLPVFVGKSAKACDILPDDRKGYIAGFKLGITTDTLDCTGKILSEKHSEVGLEVLKETTRSFLGETMQIPPMYSAVKVGGRKLYELARSGQTVERQPRKIFVDSIQITEFDETKQTGIVEIMCRKGTYVRSIIDDMGSLLGCGAMMTSLVRTFSSGFDINQAMTLNQIQIAVTENKLDTLVMPVDKAFDTYKKIKLGEFETKLYKNGVKLYPKQVKLDSDKSYDNEMFRVYGFDNEFLGLGYLDESESENLFRSRKNFY